MPLDRGASMKTWPQEEVTAMLRLWNADLTLEEMGVELGRSAQAVSMKLTKLRRAGVAIPPRERGTRGRIHKTAQRECMRCRESFKSTHHGNRLCDACLSYARTA